VPEKEHRVHHKAHGRCQRRIREAKWEGKVIKMKDGKEQKEHSGKEMTSLLCA